MTERTQWEYKKVHLDYTDGSLLSTKQKHMAVDIEELNELGAEGWEVVEGIQTIHNKQKYNGTKELLLKRPLE